MGGPQRSEPMGILYFGMDMVSMGEMVQAKRSQRCLDLFVVASRLGKIPQIDVDIG